MTPAVSKAAHEAMKRPPFDTMDIVERGFASEYLAGAETVDSVAERVRDFADGKRPPGFPPPVPDADES